MNQPSKIAIIGSTSFIGNAFKAYAFKMGVKEIMTLDRNEGYDFEDGINNFYESLCEFEPQIIVNFAAASMVAESWQDPSLYMHINATRQIALHNRLKSEPWLDLFIQFSTPEVYGSDCVPMTESHKFNPSTPYATSRAACDMSLNTFYKEYGFPVVTLRAANVYGPNQQLYRILPKAIMYAKLGKVLPLDGDGMSMRSFIHIDDVCDGIWKSMWSRAGETYHLSTAEVLPIKEVLRKIRVTYPLVTEYRKERMGKDFCYDLDSSKAEEQLGWTPKISLDEGLKTVYKWIDDNFEELKNRPTEFVL